MSIPCLCGLYHPSHCGMAELLESPLLTTDCVILSSSDPTILYRQQSDRYFLVKSLPLLFYQIKGEQNYDNEPEESTVRLWLPRP